MSKFYSAIKRFWAVRKKTLLLAGCLIALITISVAADIFEKDHALEIDFSFNGATTQSAITTETLKQLDKDVHAYIILSAGSPNNTIVSLFDRYSAITGHFTYSQENLARNPMLLTQFEELRTDEYVNSDCIVLYCESTGRARVYREDDFPVYEYSTETGYYMMTGYNYDKPFAEGIVYVSQDEPETVQLLSGHREMSGTSISVLTELLEKRNYALTDVTLLNGDTLIDGKTLVIFCPQHDLTEREYTDILAFLQKGNSMIYITDYLDTDEMPYFERILSEFGITPLRGMVLSESDAAEAYYADLPAYLMPRYSVTELTRPLLDQGKSRLIMPGSRAMRVAGSEQIDSEAFLISGKAYVRDYVRTAPDSAEKQTGDNEGYFALAAHSLRLWNNGKVSHGIVLGNSLMFTDSWLMANTDSGALFLRLLEYISGSAPVQLEIPGKSGVREALDYTSPAMPVILSLLPAGLLIAAAFLILIPRRRR